MRFVLIFIATLIIASTADAGTDYTILPGQSTGSSAIAPDGLQYRQPGEDFVLTNASIQDSSGAIHYLDFGMAYDHTDASGDIFYRPDNSQYQLYVLNNTLGSIAPQTLQAGLFTGLAELTSLGEGNYQFTGNLLAFMPAGSASPNGSGSIDLTFNSNATPGYQLTGGSLSFTPFTVPVPASSVLMVLGGLATAAGRKLFSRFSA